MKAKSILVWVLTFSVLGVLLAGCAPETTTPPAEEEGAAAEEEAGVPSEEGAPAEPAGETYKMELQAWPGGGSYLEQIKMFAERVEHMSDGRIDVTVHAGGELCPMTKEFDALESGAIEWGATCFNFNLDGIRAASSMTR